MYVSTTMTDRTANPAVTRTNPASLTDRRFQPLPNVFLRGESAVETADEPQENVVALAEARARLHQHRNGSRLLRGTDRQFAEALHREADSLHYKGDYETALVLYHRAASICPRDSSHGVAARRTAAAINALSNPSKALSGLLPKVRNGAQQSAIVCPESAALRASRILNESPDPVSVVPQILGFFDKRPDFWRITKSPRASLTRRKSTARDRSSAMSTTRIARMEALLGAGDAVAALRVSEEILVNLNRDSSAREPDAIHRIEATIHRLVALAHVALGRHDRASASASRMTRAAIAANVPLLITQALVTLGKVHLSFGHLKAAARAWERLVPCVSEPVPRAWLFHEIGRCHLESGEQRRALELAVKCLDTARYAGSEKWTFHGRLLLGQTLAQLGRFAEASNALRDLVLAGEDAGDPRTLAYVRDLADRVAEVSNSEIRRLEFPNLEGKKDVNLDENFFEENSSEFSITRSSDQSSDSDRSGKTFGALNLPKSTAADSPYNSSGSTSSLPTADSLRTTKFQPAAAAGDPGDPGDQDCGSLGPPRGSYESICCTGRTYEVSSPLPRRSFSTTTSTPRRRRRCVSDSETVISLGDEFATIFAPHQG